MKKFSCTLWVETVHLVDVEAEDHEEAAELAEQLWRSGSPYVRAWHDETLMDVEAEET